MTGDMEFKERFRRKYLSAICSPQLVNIILFGPGSLKEKIERLERAKKLARERGRERVYLDDWEDAK